MKNVLIIISVIILILAAFFAISNLFVDDRPATERSREKMELTSSAFNEGGIIPDRFTCNGDDINPPLEIGKIPDGTKSMVLTMEDPDASEKTWVHWTVWNISPRTKKIDENSIPKEAIEGLTTFGERKYKGPCPPEGPHRYIFQIYALDTTLNLPPQSVKMDIDRAMQKHILGSGELMGTFSKYQTTEE